MSESFEFHTLSGKFEILPKDRLWNVSYANQFSDNLKYRCCNGKKFLQEIVGEDDNLYSWMKFLSAEHRKEFKNMMRRSIYLKEILDILISLSNK